MSLMQRRARVVARWIIIAICGLAASMLLISLVFETEERPLEKVAEVSCEEAEGFMGKELPSDAASATCTRGNRDSLTYEVSMELPAVDFDEWILKSFPSTRLESGYCYPESVDECAQIRLGDKFGNGALLVHVEVTHVDGGSYAATLQVSGN